jgi:hypothetical protein
MTEEQGRGGGRQMASLAEAIDRLADELDEIHRHGSGQAVEYVRGATPFAVREGDRVSFRLRPEVVAAGLRTADTSLSTRGHDWITLKPSLIDGFALDRALSWFESAWRLAGQPHFEPPPSRPN